jgi:flagellar biosynthesis anti-sigma factor FlgM
MPELDRSKGSPATGLNGASESQRSAGSKATGSGDVARLSTGSEAVQNLKAELSNVPEVRHQLVESLRQAINGGTYTISPDAIAKSMLADSERGSE